MLEFFLQVPPLLSLHALLPPSLQPHTINFFSIPRRRSSTLCPPPLPSQAPMRPSFLTNPSSPSLFLAGAES
jgi:hypothetical protein